jgi:hypothetical protein
MAIHIPVYDMQRNCGDGPSLLLLDAGCLALLCLYNHQRQRAMIGMCLVQLSKPVKVYSLFSLTKINRSWYIYCKQCESDVPKVLMVGVD